MIPFAAAWGLVRGVPVLVWPLIAATVWGGVGHLKAGRLETQLLRQKNEQVTAQVDAVKRAREKDLLEIATLKEKLDAQDVVVATTRADAGKSLLAAERVRSILRTAGPDPRPTDAASSCQCPPAPNVRDILGACVGEYQRLGEAADDARTRGLECELRYNARKVTE